MTRSHVQAISAPPPRLALPGVVQGLAVGGVLVGTAALGWAFVSGELALAWSTYLIGAFFALGLGAFGVVCSPS